MKIFVLEEGAYSDRAIVGAYASVEAAQAGKQTVFDEEVASGWIYPSERTFDDWNQHRDWTISEWEVSE